MKQKTLLLCLLVSALPMTAALAQWHQTSGPSGGNTTALFAQGETLFAGNYNYSTLGNNQGDIGTLYRSTDHGQHWTPSGNGLSGVVAALTANGPTLFAGTSTGVFRSTDGGSTWSLLNGTDGMSVQKMLHANGVLYVGTSQNGIYRSPDNGNTFLPSSQGLPEIAAVSAMAHVGTTLFIGVGSLYPSPEGVFRSADGGATWQEMNNGIAGIAVIDFQVIGTDIFVTSGGALYKSTDLGANWTPVSLGTGDYPLHMQVTADGFYVALQYQTSGWTFRRSADNGATWSPAGSFTVAGNIRELAAIGSELFAGTGNYASVYRSVDSAATWQRANENMTGLDTRAIFPAGGKLFSGSLSNEGVHVSTNGGATWQPSGSGLPDPWKTVYAFAQNGSYLFAAVAYWGTYRSSDNGATWSPANGGLTFSAKRMSALAVDGNTLYAATRDGVWKSIDHGTNWTVASPPGGFGRPETLAIATLGGNVYVGTANDGLFRSSNGGTDWTPLTNGLATAGTIYSLTVGGTDLIAGTAGGVFLSADNGASWSPRNNGLIAGAARTVAAQGNTFVTAIYDDNNLLSRGVFISHDGGQSWTPYGGGLDPLAVRTLAFNGNYLLAGTEAHSILSTQPTAPLELMSAVSRKIHGSAGVFDLSLPQSGTPAVECRTGPAGHTLVVTFSNNVVSGNAAVSQGTATSGNVNFNGNTMTIGLTNVADAQTVTVDLVSVTDTFGQVLLAGSVQVSFLAGDANGDRIVNTGDTLQTRSRSGAAVDAITYRSDLNADGVINSGDALVVRSRSGNFLP